MFRVIELSFKRLMVSRLGIFLTITNLALSVYAYFQEASLGHISSFHLAHETLLVKFLVVLNLPAIIALSIILHPFSYWIEYISHYWWGQMIGIFLFVIFTSFQWILVGFMTERFLRPRKQKFE